MRAQNVVIMMGRKRCRAAWRMAPAASSPSTRRAAMAWSIIMMAFFLTMPISSRMPIMAMKLTSMPTIRKASSAPTAADGMPSRMVSGWIQLS